MRAILKPLAVMAVALLVICRSFAMDVIRIPILSHGAEPLFQVHYGDKWGYINRTGELVISPQFADEGDFFGGLAKVRLADNWGYIDRSGRVAIRYRFQYAGDFSEGLAPVMVNRLWGFVDRTGKVVIQPQFQAASEFRDGLALFEVWDTIQCDQSTYARNAAPLYAYRLHLHSPVVCFSANARFGFVDHRGTVAISPKFPVASDFSEGLAFVKLQSSPEAKYGYIDQTGKLIIGPDFDYAFPFSEGFAAVEIGAKAEAGKDFEGRWGFVNRYGSLIIKPRFREVRSFSEGLAAVSLRRDEWGYIDKSGAFVIPAKYSDAQSFSDGLALVSGNDTAVEDGRSGFYIDKTGKKALILKQPIWPFSGGLTVVGSPGAQVYVDTRGRTIAPYEVDPQP